jgi:hypothetical protein
MDAKLTSAGAGREVEKVFEQQSLQPVTSDLSSNVVLVDYEDNDSDNPLNWTKSRKWLIVLAVSWMGFVR